MPWTDLASCFVLFVGDSVVLRRSRDEVEFKKSRGECSCFTMTTMVVVVPLYIADFGLQQSLQQNHTELSCVAPLSTCKTCSIRQVNAPSMV